jgi:hypothetical protein
MTRKGIRLWMISLAALAVFAEMPLCAGVVESVEEFLAVHGMAFGYDPATETCVFIGTAERKGLDALASPAFLSLRNALVRAAERDARAEIMRMVSSTMSGVRASRLEASDEALSMSSGSIVSVFSNEPLYGCETLCVREEMDGDFLRVAVAVKWSAAMEAEAKAAKLGNVDFSGLSGGDEWTAWAGSFDFAHAGSYGTFTGSDGIRRWVGIGYADIEDKQGMLAAIAMRSAREAAGTALAHALFGEAEAMTIARQLSDARFAESQRATAMTTAEFEDRVFQAVRNKRIQDAEVYTTTVVHPLSGRRLFVSVVGIEPPDLAAMQLLGNGGENPARSPAARPDHEPRPAANRPDHSFRPPANRPDHSFRPASNRPEHPWRGEGPGRD